MEHPPGD
jgi:hypothetical protein